LTSDVLLIRRTIATLLIPPALRVAFFRLSRLMKVLNTFHVAFVTSHGGRFQDLQEVGCHVPGIHQFGLFAQKQEDLPFIKSQTSLQALIPLVCLRSAKISRDPPKPSSFCPVAHQGVQACLDLLTHLHEEILYIMLHSTLLIPIFSLVVAT
jgi:hypothetical protein